MVQKLHYLPTPNKKTRDMTEEQIVDLFLAKFEDFRFRLENAIQGQSHKWYKKHSCWYSQVLGFVGCWVTSKNVAIEVCERDWGDVKNT